MKNRAPRWLVLLAFIAIYFVWGTTYLANLFALKCIPPFMVSCLRYLLAGSLLAIWIRFKRIAVPRGQALRVLCISGVAMLVGGSGLIVFAEQYIGSGYAAALIATEPLWFVLLDRRRWALYFSEPFIFSGLILGFAGIVLFACYAPSGGGGGGGAASFLFGTILVLVSAILWVSGTLYADRAMPSGSSNLANTMVQLIAAGIFSGLVTLVRGEWMNFSVAAVPFVSWGGLLYLVVMGSLVAYLAFTWLVRVQPPAIVSTHTFVNPVVAILMGWLLAGETVAPRQVVALFVAFVGVVFAQIGKNRLALTAENA